MVTITWVIGYVLVNILYYIKEEKANMYIFK